MKKKALCRALGHGVAEAARIEYGDALKMLQRYESLSGTLDADGNLAKYKILPVEKLDDECLAFKVLVFCGKQQLMADCYTYSVPLLESGAAVPKGNVTPAMKVRLEILSGALGESISKAAELGYNEAIQMLQRSEKLTGHIPVGKPGDDFTTYEVYPIQELEDYFGESVEISTEAFYEGQYLQAHYYVYSTPIPIVLATFLEAATEGHDVATRCLLQPGMELDIDDEARKTALMLAAESGHDAVARSLLQSGVDLNARSDEGKTALMLAAESGHDAVVRSLLQPGVDLDAKTGEGKTALLLAAENGHDGIVQYLLQHGANLNVRVKYRKKFKDRLVTDVRNAKDGHAALVIAASRGYDAVLWHLLHCGTNPNEKDKYGFTALMRACCMDGTEVVRYLLQPLVNLDARDSNFGDTALAKAAQWGHDVIVQRLLQCGADPNIRNKVGSTALMEAAANGHVAVVQHLLRHGAELNAQNRAGNTALMKAAQWGHDAVVQYLLRCGADLNVENRAGNTALMKAAQWGHEKATQQLLRSGANPNSKDKQGNTALQLATSNNHESVAHQLLQAGAVVNAEGS